MRVKEVLTELGKAKKKSKRETERMLARYDYECGAVYTYFVTPTKTEAGGVC